MVDSRIKILFPLTSYIVFALTNISIPVVWFRLASPIDKQLSILSWKKRNISWMRKQKRNKRKTKENDVFSQLNLSNVLPLLLIHSELEISKNSKFLQKLNINNWRTTSAKFANLVIIRKRMKYSFKKMIVNTQITLTLFEIFLFEDRSVLWPAQQVTLPERVKLNGMKN